MKRSIISFDQDDEQHWRALLDCGHYQHVRHRPPMESREWVLDARERQKRLGMELDCRRCDEEASHPSDG